MFGVQSYFECAMCVTNSEKHIMYFSSWVFFGSPDMLGYRATNSMRENLILRCPFQPSKQLQKIRD